MTDEPDTWGTPAGRAMIELLWNPPPPSARGPRQRLTLDEVVGAATELARRSGGAELSMRGLAAQLGVGVMSLYTYVPGRDELFELMVDRAWAGRKLPDRSLGWREQVEFHAHEAWRMYRDEPWLIHSNLWRTPLGPHVLDAQEDLYRAVGLTGLPAARVVEIAGLVESHVFGAARATVTDTGVAARTGVAYDEYWESRSSFWGTYFSQERFPTMTRLWEAGGFDERVDQSWELGLALILDGVERLLGDS
ncbi:TetR/AcrR family transcriptional regulator [Pseudonocardia endophytica]|uniref:TetR family transcriptional regulator n=1 Tax=Pseudonocardia endophytica TaxID=401976 RepID=A0A4R1HE94_PSEEN|nr:TetR/AcrR family transcriptional regulator [Pseudonocardia endophytica]TCK20404.1 TetR family transcriptional regulator [Pseudonocardia endophytica]